MASIFSELALYGSKKECARTDTVFIPISEVRNDTVSLHSFSNWRMVLKISLLRRHAKMVRNGAFSHKIDYSKYVGVQNGWPHDPGSTNIGAMVKTNNKIGFKKKSFTITFEVWHLKHSLVSPPLNLWQEILCQSWNHRNAVTTNCSLASHGQGRGGGLEEIQNPGSNDKTW